MNIKPASKKVIMLTSKHEPESKTLYKKEKSKQQSMNNSVPKRGSVPDVKDQQNHKCGREKKLPTAPVKKIPNVHSVGSLPAGSGGDVQVIWRQLVQEKQRNKIIQFEVERLRKSLEVCEKTVIPNITTREQVLFVSQLQATMCLLCLFILGDNYQQCAILARLH